MSALRDGIAAFPMQVGSPHTHQLAGSMRLMNKEPFTITSGLTPVLGLWCGTCAVSALSPRQWQMPVPASEAGSPQLAHLQLCLVWVPGSSLFKILPLQENKLCQRIESLFLLWGEWAELCLERKVVTEA